MTALNEKCPICHAKPGQECVNTINPDAPVPGRRYHYARSETATIYCLRCGLKHNGGDCPNRPKGAA